ncbi:unnamed protein product [Ilex paraguariensis]|uniref:Uncharacterized protein n=1 Tax=Ilex paraguariensis TaxID=185542 RepID=A0ABC8UNX0_9AQUA
MDRRIRRSSSKAESSYLRYLKPGALAQLRDSRINAKTHRLDSKDRWFALLFREDLRRTTMPPEEEACGRQVCVLSEL